MKRKILLLSFISLMTIFILSACATNDEPAPEDDSDSMGEAMDHDMDGHMDHDEEPNLTDSTGENELEIHAAVGDERDKEDEVAHTVRTQREETEGYDGP